MKLLTGDAYIEALFAARAVGAENLFREQQTVARLADADWLARDALGCL